MLCLNRSSMLINNFFEMYVYKRHLHYRITYYPTDIYHIEIPLTIITVYNFKANPKYENLNLTKQVKCQ